MELPSILKTLGLSEQAAEVYRYLLTKKKAPARQIADALSISRPSVYDQLKVLVQEGLVVERDIEHKKYFSPDDPKKVLALLEEKRSALSAGKAAFEKLLPQLSRSHDGADPKIKFYAGKEGFRQVLTDVLVSEPKELLALWPATVMTEVVGEEYLRTFTKRRLREGLKVRAIWPLAKRKQNLIVPAEETRMAPKGTEWRMGSLIYGDKVSFIASSAESFCFTVTSRDFAELSRAQFEVLWRSSKPL